MIDIPFPKVGCHLSRGDSTAARFGKVLLHAAQQVEEIPGRLFSRFDSGLMIGIDVDEARVKRNGALEESNQGAQRFRRQLMEGRPLS